MRAKDALGRYGEDVAARFLSDSGVVILDRNWRCDAGELDIVGLDGRCLVFCEVKTRSGAGFGSPAEAVDRRKLARLRLLAQRWLCEQRPPWTPELRFDVVAVTRPARGAAVVEHLKAVG